MELDLFDLDLNFDIDTLADDTPKEKESVKVEETEKHIKVSHRKGKRYLTRKAASEKALEEQLDWHFQPGDCYHCFSFGDVDSMSFFKHILKQQRIIYAAISTWVIAGEDIKDLAKWHRRGLVGRVDLYMGEIFRGSYPEAYDMAVRFIRQCGGRLVVFRNHAKVMAIKGERFDCLIESSANINTNPRSENTVITVDSGLVDEYINLFGEINPFNKDCGAEPYKVVT